MANKRSVPWVLLSIIVLLAGGSALWFFLPRGADKAPEITSVQVARGDLVMSVTAAGTLEPVTTVEVSSQVSGLIKEVLVDYNSMVKQGDVLARLDPATYDQRLKQATAELASSQANTTLVGLNSARTHKLFEKGLATQQEKDEADALLAQAKAQLQTKQASVDNAKVDLSRCTIYAPIDGLVMQRNADVGKTVAASLNAPTLFIIANELARMQIVAAVAEADVGNVEDRQLVNFTVDAYPGRQFKGVVRQIRNYPVTQSNVVTYQTIIEVNNDDLKLKPGMTANVAVVISQRNQSLRIPNSALRARIPENLIARKVELPSNSAPSAPPAPVKQVSNEERRKIMREIFQQVGYAWGSGAPSPEMAEQIKKLAAERGIDFDVSRLGAGQPPKSSQVGAPVTRTVYRLAADSKPGKPVIEAVTVKLGISDGTYTELIEGLAEGDTLVTGVTVASGTSASANPMMPSFGGPRR